MEKRRLLTQWWGGDDVRAYSSVCVTEPSLVMGAKNTVFDPRFGSTERGERCVVCNGSQQTCPGHFGHIELAKPCFHPFRSGKLYERLKKRCIWCKKDVDAAPPTETHVVGGKRHCRSCRYPIGKWARKGVDFSLTYTDKQCREHPTLLRNPRRELSMQEVVDLLHGEAVLAVLPVPPMSIRPSVVTKSKWSHDPLSRHYALIVGQNNRLRTLVTLQRPPHVIKIQWNKLQSLVDKLFDTNDDERMKGLRQRLDGKQGRFRKNLQGKRVNFSARTVITGDPSLDLDQVGVPRSIASRLSVPVRVTTFNQELLQECVGRGAYTDGGALYVERSSDGTLYDLQTCARVVLNVGDVVERMLRNDDVVIMNRQPTLHRMSMMAHRVKILPYSTFRLNLSVTSPYNAASREAAAPKASAFFLLFCFLPNVPLFCVLILFRLPLSATGF